jgi:hypothetical protein
MADILALLTAATPTRGISVRKLRRVGAAWVISNPDSSAGEATAEGWIRSARRAPQLSSSQWIQALYEEAGLGKGEVAGLCRWLVMVLISLSPPRRRIKSGWSVRLAHLSPGSSGDQSLGVGPCRREPFLLKESCRIG